MKGLIVDVNLLDMLLEGDSASFFSYIENADAYNILFAVAKGISPSVLLNKSSELKWDGRIVPRNNYVARFDESLEYTIKNVDNVSVGLRNIPNVSLSLALYYPNPDYDIVFTLLGFWDKITCSRIIPYSEYENAESVLKEREISSQDIFKIKRNMSLFYSSKVYKERDGYKVGEML